MKPRNFAQLQDLLNLCDWEHQVRVIDEIRNERAKQVVQHGYDANHDDEHNGGELAYAAVCYACEGAGEHDEDNYPPALWPWEADSWKPGDARSMLVKAAALIVAEIERLDRIEERGNR